MINREDSLKANNLTLLLLRGITGLLAMGCNFYALAHLELGDTSVLIHSFPLWAVLFAALLLGEKITKPLLFWLGIAWVGIAFIMRPQLDVVNYAGFVALLGSLFVAINAVVIRQSHRHDSALRIAFYFSVICTVGTAPIMMQEYIAPSTVEWLLLAACGIFGSIGQILITYAYGMGQVSDLAPLSYAGVIISFIYGAIFWNEIPSIWTAVGSVIVIFSCINVFKLRKPVPVVNHPS